MEIWLKRNGKVIGEPKELIGIVKNDIRPKKAKRKSELDGI
jgi:hypothetical protein